MTTSWTAPARVLTDHIPRTLGGLWSLLYTSELATLHASLDYRPGTDPAAERALSGVVMDLREAVEELEWGHPDLDIDSAAVDLGHLSPGTTDEDLEVMAGLLAAALTLCAELIDGAGLPVEDVLMLARIVRLTASAHHQLTGQLP